MPGVVNHDGPRNLLHTPHGRGSVACLNSSIALHAHRRSGRLASRPALHLLRKPHCLEFPCAESHPRASSSANSYPPPSTTETCLRGLRDEDPFFRVYTIGDRHQVPLAFHFEHFPPTLRPHAAALLFVPPQNLVCTQFRTNTVALLLVSHGPIESQHRPHTEHTHQELRIISSSARASCETQCWRRSGARAAAEAAVAAAANRRPEVATATTTAAAVAVPATPHGPPRATAPRANRHGQSSACGAVRSTSATPASVTTTTNTTTTISMACIRVLSRNRRWDCAMATCLPASRLSIIWTSTPGPSSPSICSPTSIPRLPRPCPAPPRPRPRR